ncbi:Cof-type HAD-IIB family hydrolase [Terribacillus sp. 179-K 1B1 HS]|uniref:Cof-type HAD-IIB family hydrolase n=1 Tax=Terribacillus sp. 179-K 1B1 HS TaxID=3142388 RepID=UPI0039A01BB0
MRKLAAIDLDGTFLNQDYTITPLHAAAVKKAQQKGAEIIIATGRANFDVHRLFRDQQLSTWVIGANGATTYDPAGNLTVSLPLETIYAKEIVTWLNEENYYYEIVTDKEIFITSKAKQLLLDEMDVVQNVDRSEMERVCKRQLGQTNLQEIEDYIEVFQSEKEIYKITIVSFDEERQRVAADTLSKKGLNLFSSSDFNLEIVDGKASKGHALKKLAKKLDFKKEDIIAIGDSMNDLPMLEEAGTKVAMGNATEEVKQYCDYTTETNENGGVARTLEREILKK